MLGGSKWVLGATVCFSAVLFFGSSSSAQTTTPSGNTCPPSETEGSCASAPPSSSILVHDTVELPDSTVKFEGNTFLILGYGSIARGILPLILRHIELRTDQIVILTHPKDKSYVEKDEVVQSNGIRVVYGTLTPDVKENEKLLGSIGLQEGDFVLNLTADVDSNMVIRFAVSRGMLYLDTTTDVFEHDYDLDGVTTNEDWGDPKIDWKATTYYMRETLLSLKSEFGPHASTALSSHGANPGMVSHFVKQSLVNMAAAAGIKLLEEPNTQREWAALAQKLDVRTIQISEYDSQYRMQRRRFNEFVSTWSVDAFTTEAEANSEVGWGTHEHSLPLDGVRPIRGSKVAMVLDRSGGEVFLRSWSPLRGPFHGMCGSHTESISISHYLSLWNESEQLVYRPSTMFVYRPCDDCLLSVHELVANDFKEPETKTILNSHEIVEGEDELGVLIGSGKYGSYWYGSQLTAKRANELVPGNQATTLGVTATGIAGIMWVLQNPRRGVVEPDELPYRPILDILEPYLAPIVGVFSSWTPATNGTGQPQPSNGTDHVQGHDPWQFSNVRV